MVSLRAALLGGALLLLTAAASAVEPGREVYVINTSPPAVSVVDTTDWKIVRNIPLDPEPTYAIMGADNGYLYVLHNGIYRQDRMLREGLSDLSIVNLSNQAVRKIRLGWNTSGLVLSNDGRYLLCVSQGKVGKKNAEDEYGAVTLTETGKNAVAATLSAGRLGAQAALSADLSKIVVLSPGEPAGKKGGKATPAALGIFAIDRDQPLAEFEFDQATSLRLSSDEKWAYVLDPGGFSKRPVERRAGVLHVIDLDARRIAADYEVGFQPHGLRSDAESGTVTLSSRVSAADSRRRLLRFSAADPPEVIAPGSEIDFVRRLAGEHGLFTFGYGEMGFVPDGSAKPAFTIPLNPESKGADVPALGGIPGEILQPPNSRRVAMTVLTRLGAPTGKVAIVNLADRKVEHVVTTGRGSVKFGKFMGMLAQSAVIARFSYYYGNLSAAQATGSPFFFYNIYAVTPSQPNVELAASPNGRFVYALNTQTNDVTIIRTDDGSADVKISIGGGCRRIDLAPGGRFIYSHTGRQFNLIDSGTGEKRLEHHVQDGRIRNVIALPSENRLIVLTSKSILIVDTEKGPGR
jgi:DNA-binding beta-propeller fold protein YncE